MPQTACIVLVFVAMGDLVETLAERIAAIVLEEFDVKWLKLRLGKPGAVTGSKDVGVIIERRASSASS